jgi:hypothetical protein
MEDFLWLLLAMFGLLFELGPALLDLRCSEVPSRAAGTGLFSCDSCTVNVLVVDALAVDPDPATETDVLDPALVVRALTSASPEEEEAASDVTVSSESADLLDLLDLLDLATSVVAPLPSVLSAEESHEDAVPSKSPADLLDPAVAAASLRSTLSGEEESRAVMVFLESSFRSSTSFISTSCVLTAELEGSDEVGCEARCVSRSNSRIPGERKTLSSEPSGALLACRAVVFSSGRTMAILQLLSLSSLYSSPLR